MIVDGPSLDRMESAISDRASGDTVNVWVFRMRELIRLARLGLEYEEIKKRVDWSCKLEADLVQDEDKK